MLISMKYVPLLLALAACGNPHHHVLFAEDPADVPALQTAAGEWAACDRSVDLRVTTDRSQADAYVIRVDNLVIDNRQYWGYTFSPPNEMIEYDASVPDDMKTTVLAHEIGHLMGLHHYATGIMRPDVPSPSTVTPDDCAHLDNGS